MNKYLKTGVSLVILLTLIWATFASINANDEQSALMFAVMTVAMGILLFFDLTKGRKVFSRPSFRARATIAGVAMWTLVLQLWGFIWGWHRYFDGLQFFVLHLAVPVVAWAAWRGYRWVTRTG